MSQITTQYQPKCGACGTHLKFVRWSKRLPAKSEALAKCPSCGAKWQIRYWQGKPSSEPYQVKRKAQKTCRGSYKLSPERKAAIKAIFGSVQNFLDTAPLVGMSLQSKS